MNLQLPSKLRPGGNRPRLTTAEISPTSSVTAGTTRAIIERTRSSRITNSADQKAATLPRKGGGLFVKAHEGARNKIQPKPQQVETFVDNPADCNEEETAKTQTLPRSYKTGCSNHNIPDSLGLVNRTQSTSVLSNGVNLVLSANSFVSSTMKPTGNQASPANADCIPIQKPIRPVLTVQEKLAQDLPSLPPQVGKVA